MDGARRPANKMAEVVTSGGETPEQEAAAKLERDRENLVAQHKLLVLKMKATPKHEKVYRKALGQQIQDVQDQISAIRPKTKSPKSVGAHFIDVCREKMTRFEFDRVMKEANRRADHEQTN